MPKAKLKVAKDNTPNEPFEFKMLSPRLVQYSLRESHMAILGLDEFKERYEIIPDQPAEQEPPQQAA